MITPQNGIFAQGTHAHYFLELDLRPGIPGWRAHSSFRRLRAPDVSAGGVNFVLAYLRPRLHYQGDKWLGLPKEAVRDVLRIYLLVVPLFLTASLVEFFAA